MFNWQEVHSEVAAESRGRIALAGLAGVGKAALYNRMMGWQALGRERPAEADLGAFSLVDLPAGGEMSPEIPMFGGLLEQVDLILFVLDARWGLRPPEYAWFSRLRGTGTPVLPLLVSPRLEALQPAQAIAQRLGTPVLPVALDDTHLAEQLSQRVLAVCPDLAIPLGQHFRAVRRQAAQRVILQTAALSGIVGLEPVPMLDAPLQLAAQGGMVLRVGAIYGHPNGRGWPPELLGSTLTGVLLRLAAQQAVKWVPVAGWAVGGAIALVGTWVLGQAAIRYFEADRGSNWLRVARRRKEWLQTRLLPHQGDNGAKQIPDSAGGSKPWPRRGARRVRRWIATQRNRLGRPHWSRWTVGGDPPPMSPGVDPKPVATVSETAPSQAAENKSKTCPGKEPFGGDGLSPEPAREEWMLDKPG